MSKNFELLQRIGFDEELFQTGCPPTEDDLAKGGRTYPELDKEAREKILQNASLPDVLEGARNEPLSALAGLSELNIDVNEERDAKSHVETLPLEQFRTSRNPSSPIGEPAKGAEKRATPSNGNNGFHSKTSSAEKKSRTSYEETSSEARPEAEREPAPTIFREASLPRPWADAIRTAPKRWGWRPLGSDNHHGRNGVEVDEIAREEELKLVQRVFPGTDDSSPRAVLFARLDGEAGCAAICARAGEILAARGEGRVCVVDANFGRPSLHEYFDIENVNGLAEAAIEGGRMERFAQQTQHPDLWLMPSGKMAGKLRFPAMADRLRLGMEELRRNFRYVVLHSGPPRLENSSMLLSRWADGVVLVVEANSTRKDTTRRVKEILDAAHVSVLGIVLRNRTFPIPEAIYRRL
jgi:Mrp family chromosome partitioning ATPase